MDEGLRQNKLFLASLAPVAEHYFKLEALPAREGTEGEAAKLLLDKPNHEEREKSCRGLPSSKGPNPLPFSRITRWPHHRRS
jgi:hypothetical protein